MPTILDVILEADPTSIEVMRKRVQALADSENPPVSGADRFTRLQQIPQLHFMSMEIFEDEHYDPLLVFENNFDGPRGPYWEVVLDQLSEDLRSILACTKQAKLDAWKSLFAAGSTQSLAPFLEAHSCGPSAQHFGAVANSLPRIHRDAGVFDDLQTELGATTEKYRDLDATGVQRKLRQWATAKYSWMNRPESPSTAQAISAYKWSALGPALAALTAFVAGIGVFLWLCISDHLPDHGDPDARIVLRVLLVLAIVAGVTIAVLFWRRVRHLEETDFTQDDAEPSAAQMKLFASQEDQIVQNHLAAAARPNAWVTQLAPRITDSTGPRDLSLNVAFSAAGLKLLGVKDDVMATFSLPFQQGMTTDNRARFLGDTPAGWSWSDCAGSPGCIHAQLMIYARDAAALAAAVAAETAALASFDLTALVQIPQQVNLAPDGQRHEHFGFADGVSQPILVDGSIPAANRALHEIPVGEVVLGQTNTYGAPAPGPVVPASPVAAENLRPSASTEGLFDLGLNGTYLVLRQLKQDVAKFWTSMQKAAERLVDESGAAATDLWLAQKAVGRTLDGDMLTPAGPVSGNDMTFFATDVEGFGCPMTAHVRRANPRDGLAPTVKDTQDMINATNRHRIVRRGRIYGAPIADRYKDDGVDRGLLFICMNSEIERQFEFVQHTWLLNPMFGLGYNESDPILGKSCPFSIPSKPVRQQPTLETFITPVGGGYFFVPSLRALRYLGALQ